MSSKLAALTTLLLVALLALAEATTYTTITTTTVDEEAAANPRGSTGSKSCDEKQMMKMSHCMMYLACKKGESSESLRMVVNRRSGQQCEEKHIDQCCNELGNMPEECRCQAIKMMVMQMEQVAGPEQMRGMRQMAQDLPNRCNMGPQKCHMRAIWF